MLKHRGSHYYPLVVLAGNLQSKTLLDRRVKKRDQYFQIKFGITIVVSNFHH